MACGENLDSSWSGTDFMPVSEKISGNKQFLHDEMIGVEFWSSLSFQPFFTLACKIFHFLVSRYLNLICRKRIILQLNMEEKPVPSSSREETGRRASGRKGCCGIAGYKTTGNGTKEFPIPVKPKSDSYPRPGVLYRLRSGSSLGGTDCQGSLFFGSSSLLLKDK